MNTASELFAKICDSIFSDVSKSTTLDTTIKLLENDLKQGWPIFNKNKKEQLMSLFGWNVIIQHIVQDQSFDIYIRDLACSDRFSGEIFCKPRYDPPLNLNDMDLETCVIRNMRIHEHEDCPNIWCPNMGNCECFGLSDESILYDCGGDELFSYETDEESSESF